MRREVRETRALDAQSRPHDIQGIRERNARDTSQPTTQEPLKRTPRQIIPRHVLEESFVQVVAPELHRAVRHDADAVGPVSRHEAAPALLAPHLPQRLADAELVLRAAGGLHLEEDLEALERGDDGAGDGAGDAACAEGGEERRAEGLAEGA